MKKDETKELILRETIQLIREKDGDLSKVTARLIAPQKEQNYFIFVSIKIIPISSQIICHLNKFWFCRNIFHLFCILIKRISSCSSANNNKSIYYKRLFITMNKALEVC